MSGEIRLWDGKTGALKKVLANQGGVGWLAALFARMAACCCPPAAAAGCALTQRIYDAASGKELTAYAKHDNVVGASAFSPDGSARGDRRRRRQMPIHVWDPKTGETKAVLKGAGRRVWAAGFSADGRSIAWGKQRLSQEQTD